MQLGMIGLGRMGGNMVVRLSRAGHECVVADLNQKRMKEVVDQTDSKAKATPSSSLEDFISKLKPPRAVWLMVAAAAVDGMIRKLVPLLQKGDILIDGGNSYYIDDIRRGKELAGKGLHYLDVGTSGGIWGKDRGYCLMIGGETEPVKYLDPVFRALAPSRGNAARTPSRANKSVAGTAEDGYLHCGPYGAGHFVKMVHNGIEYGLMASYAEGLNIIKHANAGQHAREESAEVTPMREPEHYMYDFNLGDITELWRRGSVVASWLLDLTADALSEDGELSLDKDEVPDSGEGRWTVMAAIDEGVQATVLSAALYQRFISRGADSFACRAVQAMRRKFGGHQAERPAGG